MWAYFEFSKIKISDFAQANTARSRIFREYLGKNEFLSKTILACLSGARMGLIHEINKCQNILWHFPFNKQHFKDKFWIWGP